jgi:tRNA modification GTPase
MSPTDTIVAVATPPGRAGLGVVRLSGPEAAAIAQRLVDRPRPFEPRRATFCRVRAGGGDAGALLDEVVCTWFPAPASYTGDDVVEVTGHGNPVVLGAVVERALSAGARLARPGEFTFRAYLNGRLDLVQAEAIADLIDAVTPAQARLASDQLDGTLTREIAALALRVTSALASVEAAIDFPDERDEIVRAPAAIGEVAALLARVGELVAGARRGRLIREGAQVVLAGPPNAGKSSLFNRLLAADRAIVSDVPGTTRDLVTERCDLQGIPVTLVDTAGLSEAGDLVERAGVRRAHAALGAADLVVLVLDGSAPLGVAARAQAARLPGDRLIVAANKCDLAHAWPLDTHDIGVPAASPVLRVSATSGAGIDALVTAVAAALGAGEGPPRDPPTVTNLRHATLLARVEASLRRAHDLLLHDGGDELAAAELHEAHAALREVTGHGARDAVLHEIFARFCLGK